MTPFLGILLVFAIMFVAACLGGFILWLIWPTAISVFPGLHPYVLMEPSLLQCICLAWAAGILIKGSSASNTSEK